MNKAVFFDRDGTINVEVGYLSNFDRFQWIDGAIDAIKFCNRHGYLTIVVTNQSGVARGYYSETDVINLHRRINVELAKYDAHIDDFFYCPHHPRGAIEKYAVECQCRKPKPQLILDACRKHFIDKDRSILIGDMPRDVESAINAGIRGFIFDGVNLLDTLKSALATVDNNFD